MNPAKASTLGALVAGMSLAFSTAANGADVAGSYKCEGDNGYGGKYTGKVTIVQKGDTYRVVWNLGSNGAYFGLGVLQGDVLAVSYYDTKLGVIAYQIESDS